MDKYQFTFSYNVTVMANSKIDATIKAIDILANINDLSLKLWLSTHYKVEQVIESDGDLADIN